MQTRHVGSGSGNPRELSYLAVLVISSVRYGGILFSTITM